jgi:signal peptidase I
MAKTEHDKAMEDLAGVRDTVESVWIAIVLAFILRAFMIEAFVIPTGSMAPRLMGAHYQLTCPACGWEYAYGFDAVKDRLPPGDRQMPPGARCPNCGRDYNEDAGLAGQGPPVRVRNGDRVLVMKWLYNFSPPQPWDVVVFRNPQDNDQNYIKRLIGLPGETIQIAHGDIFVKPDGSDAYRVRRKTDPRTQLAMWQVVYDNDYPPLADPDEPVSEDTPRWVAAADSPWNLQAGQSRQFSFPGSDKGTWQSIRLKADRAAFQPYYGYNPNSSEDRGNFDLNLATCSDLKLSTVWMPADNTARLALLVTSFDHVFMAMVVADGRAQLMHANVTPDGPADLLGDPAVKWESWSPTVKVDIPADGRTGRRIELLHVDFQVKLLIDGKVVLQTDDQTYRAELREDGPRTILTVNNKDRIVAERHPADPTQIDIYTADREPVPTPQVQIAAADGASVLRHVSVMRDVYYTRFSLEPTWRQTGRDEKAPLYTDYSESLGYQRGDPGWGTMGNPIHLKRHDDPARRELDEFYMLGDNSPRSLDSRAWLSAAPTLRLYENTPQGRKAIYQPGTVPRYNLIGKALFVYWPAGFRLPGLDLPIVPNVGKMRLIR